MLERYRQRTYTDNKGNRVSGRYFLYSSLESKTIVLENDLSLDEISLKYYGTPLYYWLIGEANNVSDPFIKLKKGDSVKIPII